MESDIRKQLIPKVALPAILTFISAVLLTRGNNLSLAFIFCGAAIFTFLKLLWFIEGKAGKPSSLNDEVLFDEVSQTFKSITENTSTDKINLLLNDAVTKIKSARREQDSDLQFFKNVVQHIGIGLIAFRKDGSVQIANSAAKRLLKLNRVSTISDIKEVSEPLVDSVLRLKTGGRELVPMKLGDETFQLSVYAIELTLRGEVLKLISITNIQSEYSFLARPFLPTMK